MGPSRSCSCCYSTFIPPKTVTTLLNLAEFMEHDEKARLLDTQELCRSLLFDFCARFEPDRRCHRPAFC